MQLSLWIVWVMMAAWWHSLAAQSSTLLQTHARTTTFLSTEKQTFSSLPMVRASYSSTSLTELGISTSISLEFLSIPYNERFSYINPMSTEVEKNLYSQNIPLVLFAAASHGEFEAIFKKRTKGLSPYQNKPVYVPTSSTRWYVGDRLFAVDNSAFFGIEFDSSFAYRGGVVRIGDSSEKAVVILVSLYPNP